MGNIFLRRTAHTLILLLILTALASGRGEMHRLTSADSAKSVAFTMALPAGAVAEIYDLNQLDLYAAGFPLLSATLPAQPFLIVLLLSALIWMGIREMRLKREIQATRTALNASSEGFLIVSLEGAVIDYNRRLEELWAFPIPSRRLRRADEFLRIACGQLLNPEEFLGSVLRLRAGPQVIPEDLIKLKDGRLLSRRVEPLRNGERVVGRIWRFRDSTQCRKTEVSCLTKLAALEEKSRAFRTFIDSVPECIYFKDRESRFTRVNLALAHAHGYTDCQTMIGKSDFDSCAKEHALEAYTDEQALVNETVPIISKEEKETWPDGRETWVLTTKLPLRDSQGNVIGTFGISRDISERKRIEQSLCERERWLSAVLGSIRDSVIALDSLGFIQWINPRAVELTGGSCDESCGKLFEEVLHFDAADRTAADPESSLMNGLLSGRVKSLERVDATLKRADGTIVLVELTGSAIEVGDNTIAGAVLVLRPASAPDKGLSGS